MALTYEQMREALELLEKWAAVRKAEDRWSGDFDSIMICAEHSNRGGLLAWLRDGNEPLEKPPPLHLSRPWHQLIKDGKCDGETALFFGDGKGWPKEMVSIGQHAGWRLEEDVSDTVKIISYPGHGRWRLEILEDKGNGWAHIRLERLP